MDKTGFETHDEYIRALYAAERGIPMFALALLSAHRHYPCSLSADRLQGHPLLPWWPDGEHAAPQLTFAAFSAKLH